MCGKVRGKCVNRGAGYGVEIPEEYAFIGLQKAVEWVQKTVKKILKRVDMKTKRSTSQSCV